MLFMYNFVNFCTYFHGISNARAWILTVCPFSTYLLERKTLVCNMTGWVEECASLSSDTIRSYDHWLLLLSDIVYLAILILPQIVGVAADFMLQLVTVQAPHRLLFL